MADGSDPWHPAAEQPPSLHAHHDYQAVLFHRLRNFWHGKRWNRHLYVIPDDNDGPHLLLPDSYGLPPRGKNRLVHRAAGLFCAGSFPCDVQPDNVEGYLIRRSGAAVCHFPLEAFKSIPQRRVHLACAAHVYHHRGFDEPFAYKRFFGLCAVQPVCRGDAA